MAYTQKKTSNLWIPGSDLVRSESWVADEKTNQVHRSVNIYNHREAASHAWLGHGKQATRNKERNRHRCASMHWTTIYRNLYTLDKSWATNWLDSVFYAINPEYVAGCHLLDNVGLSAWRMYWNMSVIYSIICFATTRALPMPAKAPSAIRKGYAGWQQYPTTPLHNSWSRGVLATIPVW